MRGLILALLAASVWGATQQLRSTNAVGSLAHEPFQQAQDTGAGTKLTELFAQGSDILHRVPVPEVVKQFSGAFSSVSLRAEQDTVDASAHQQILWMLLYTLLYVLWVALFIGLWVALIAVVGYFYTKNKQYMPAEEGLATPEQQTAFQDWKFGFCSCLGDLEVCFCACCCPCIRWGETLSLVDGLVIFWVGFAVYLGLTTLSWYTSVPLCWLLLTLICTAYRQEIRIKFQMERVGGMTYITDCLLYAFCACCAISQEARHVEEALKYGHKAVAVPERE